MADISLLNTTAQLSGKTVVTEEGDWTITGNHTFDRDPSAPFTVTSGSAVVTNLDADKLDGNEASAFAVLADNETITGNWVTTGTFTLGDGSAADEQINFDGNAQDYYIGLDDSEDDLVIGLGTTVGTTPAIGVDENQDVRLWQDLQVDGPSITIGDGTAEDTQLTFNGNAQDYYIGLDDGTDDLIIGLGSAVGTTPAISIDENQLVTFANPPAGTPKTLYVGTTQNATDDGTLETLDSYTVPADTLAAAGDRLTVRASGTLAADTDSKILSLDWGSAVVVSQTTAVAGNTRWVLEAEIIMTGVGTQDTNGNISLDSAQNNGTTNFVTATEDETAGVLIKLEGDGINANDIVCETMTVVVWPAP